MHAAPDSAQAKRFWPTRMRSHEGRMQPSSAALNSYINTINKCIFEFS